MKVRPIANVGDLRIEGVYEVLGIEANSYRLLNECIDPCLYEANLFEIVEASEPKFWVTTFGEDGERYSYPPNWSNPGFFEDFHENVQSVTELFWRDLALLYFDNA